MYVQSKGKLVGLGMKIDDSSEDEHVEQMPLFNPEGEKEDDDDDDDVDLFSVPLN